MSKSLDISIECREWSEGRVPRSAENGREAKHGIGRWDTLSVKEYVFTIKNGL